MLSSSRSSRRLASPSRPSVDLAGRAVALSVDVPAQFDAPLAPHHKVLGRWVAEREKTAQRYTRMGVRKRIERVFSAAVDEILSPFNLADLRVVALTGEDDRPPAIVIVCDTIGQLELGWIEKSNLLRDTAFGNVAPVRWRAAAYQTLRNTLPAVLPAFGYEVLFEEVSAYYWDGETDDERARAALIELHGHGEDDLDEMTLPSDMNARRPDWMTAKAAPLKDMPVALQAAIRRLRAALEAMRKIDPARNAWRFDHDNVLTYLPEYEERTHMPPITLVPFEQFARELDDVGRFGMEQGFYDIAGFCQLIDVATVDAWFASLRVGAELLLAAQDLINLDPANPVKP